MDETASKVAIEKKNANISARLLGALQKKGSITIRKQLKAAWLFVMG